MGVNIDNFVFILIDKIYEVCLILIFVNYWLLKKCIIRNINILNFKLVLKIKYYICDGYMFLVFLNCWLVVNKMVVINDYIVFNNIDFLVFIEMWFGKENDNVILFEFILEGFFVL